MIEDKMSARIRQTPKYMEKMLLVNHKEEQGLQRRLEDISTDSRIKGRQLDRERIKVRNEWRFYSRLNYPSVAPLLGQIPSLIHRGHHKAREPSDLVNEYLLREYRRNSQVIPSILSSVGKEMEIHHNKVKENETKEALRKGKLSAASTSSLSQQPASKKTVDAKTVELANSLENGSQTPRNENNDEVVEANRITGLVREITKLRNDMLANKKIDVMRSKVSFPDLLRNLQEKENHESDSQTYTDGTCVLLRRKMQRMRKQNCSEPEVEVYALLGQGSPLGNGHSANGTTSRPIRKRHSVTQSLPSSSTARLPSVSTNRNASAMSAIARLDILENDERELKRQLEDQGRHQTEVKVAMENRKYRRIQERIGEFLEKNKVKTRLPLVYESNPS